MTQALTSSPAPASTPADCDRFVLDTSDPFLLNLAALWARQPTLARDIERLEIESNSNTTSLRIEPARSGSLTASVERDGRRVQLLSRYDPAADAKQTIERTDLTSAHVVFLLGLELGYTLEALLPRLGKHDRVWVLEPHLPTIRAALQRADFSDAIESGRLLIHASIDRTSMLEQLNTLAAMVIAGNVTIEHAGSARISPDFFEQARQWVEEARSYARTTVNTILINSAKTAHNVAMNLPRYVTGGSLHDLAGIGQGKPAIIISAGPSLRKNRHALLDARGKAIFIATQTTLQPMLDMGIEVDFVTSLDYSDISRRFYERLPRSCRTHLVAEAKASDAIFDFFPGPITLLGNEFADELIREMKPDKPRLRSGATVAHLAFYLAEHLRCDPIIFVGQDLGFSDALAYLPGTAYDDVWRCELSRFCSVEAKQWEHIARDRHILRRLPDWNDRPIYTEDRLFAYLQQFERDFARSYARIIDATEGGVRKRHATPMPLAQAIAQFCTSTTDVAVKRHRGSLDDEQLQRARNCLRMRLDEARQIEQIARQTAPILNQIRQSIGDHARVNALIGQLDQTRVRLTEFDRTYELITQLNQQGEMNRLRADLIAGRPLKSGESEQSRQIERDLRNVESIAKATQDFIDLIQRAIDRMGGQAC